MHKLRCHPGTIGIAIDGASWCDYDRDGDLDLALQPYATVGQDRARLLRNQGDGTFVDVAP